MILCFMLDYHEWLLGEEVDILPSLLLPLAGPEQYEEQEMEKLPEDLQYLPDDKQRETDPDIRKMLIEALTKVKTSTYLHGWLFYFFHSFLALLYKTWTGALS